MDDPRVDDEEPVVAPDHTDRSGRRTRSAGRRRDRRPRSRRTCPEGRGRRARLASEGAGVTRRTGATRSALSIQSDVPPATLAALTHRSPGGPPWRPRPRPSGGRRHRAARPPLAARWPAWAAMLLVHGLAEHAGATSTWATASPRPASSVDALRPARVRRVRRAARLASTAGADYHDDLEERLAAVREAASGRPVVALRPLAGRADRARLRRRRAGAAAAGRSWS